MANFCNITYPYKLCLKCKIPLQKRTKRIHDKKKVLHLLNTCSSLLMQKTSLYKYVQFEPFAKLSYDSISKHYTQ